jgi:hypothetical protein
MRPEKDCLIGPSLVQQKPGRIRWILEHRDP